MARQRFIKSADTSTSPANSRAEIEKMLRRYGAIGFAVQQEFDANGTGTRVVVEFLVPNTQAKDAAKVPVRLPVDVRQIYHALYERPTRWTIDDETKRGKRVYDPKGYDAKKLAQAERVAWRNLVLWIDAALSAANAGLQTITEAFFAHTIVALEDGQTVRLADYMERTQGALAPGVRALLAAPAEEE